AYIPAFCDIVVMVDGNASMYLGSPRMAEMVIGEKVGLEEMGGAKMHCSTSGCGDVLASTEEEAILYTKQYLSYFPSKYKHNPSAQPAKAAKSFETSLSDILPENQNAAFNMYDLIERTVDEDSFCEIKKLFAPEIITGLGRIEGESVGIIEIGRAHV